MTFRMQTVILVTVTETQMVIIISRTKMVQDLRTTETGHGVMKMAAVIQK